MLERIRRVAERPKVEVHNEGPSSEKTPILSVRFGNPDGSRLLAEPDVIGVSDAHAMTGGPVFGGAGPDAQSLKE